MSATEKSVWQERLAHSPEDLAAARIEDAALTPDGPSIDRARTWLTDGRENLRRP